MYSKSFDKFTDKAYTTCFRYVAWNVHEPEQGTYNFDGDADIVSFVKLVQETGLLLILRPGLYSLLL